MSVKVKICGIRNIQAARVAIQAGADFLGFNFVQSSKRYINPVAALEIINLIRGEVKIVGVFQDAEISEVNRIASELKLDFVQLHGQENTEYIEKVKVSVIKAIKENYQPDKINAKYFLLDRHKRGQGEMVDLEKANVLAADLPLFYAGGLTPDNVATIIKKVNPFAVDVASGIETDHYQDTKKIKLFIRNAKGVNL